MIAVENFLPKYPSFSSRNYPYYDEPAETVLADKLEFTELALSPTTIGKKTASGLFYHQTYVSRFASSFTNYDELLLVHEMGTGKTCTAIGVAEKLRYEPRSWIRGAVFVAKGTGLLKNFVNELLFVCTDGRYVPENYDGLSELEKTLRVNKIIKKYYELKTFETFASEIATTSDSTLKAKYNDKLLIFDEVHNVRQKFGALKPKELDVYASIHRLCHALDRRKVLLMSGTPMKDDPSEIASVMNLLLPIDAQLPVGKRFKSVFMNDGTLKDADEIVALSDAIRGKTSFLKASTALNVPKTFVGNERVGDLRHFVVYDARMSDFQAKGYVDAYRKDKGSEKTKTLDEKYDLEYELFGSSDEDTDDDEEERRAGETSTLRKKKIGGGIFLSSQQASLFVFPNGSYGSAGFDRYVKKTSAKDTSIRSYELTSELVDQLTSEANGDAVKIAINVGKFSSKYSRALSRILESGNKTFVYCNFVSGSGAILFCKLLELCGFASATSKSVGARKRYALVTNKTMSEKGIRQMIDKFNETDNVDGSIIRVLVGSRVINEGFTLRNVLDEHILTPHWNYSETAQAIARGWRTGSHVGNVDGVKLSVFQHVALYGDDGADGGEGINDGAVKSIDLLMYEKSEKKDVAIKSIERIIKTISFDCPLAKYQNRSSDDMDGQRECEYASCAYDCVGGVVGAGSDDVTRNLYYSSDKTFVAIKKILTDSFLRSSVVSVDDVKKRLTGIYESSLNEYEFSDALVKIIYDDAIFVDRYGFKSYVRIKGDWLYASASPEIYAQSDRFVDEIKLKYVELDIPFDAVYRRVYDANIGSVIKKILDETDERSRRRMVANLDEFGQRMLLEICLLKRFIKTGGALNESWKDAMDNLLTTYYKDFYGQTPDKRWYITLYADKLDGPECYDESDESWKSCDVATETSRIDDGNGIGYYGLYNPRLDQFCIKDVRGEPEVSDVRKKRVGRRCMDWESYKLVEMLVNDIKLDPPSEWIFDETLARRRLETFSKGRLLNVIDENDVDAMKRFYYWSDAKRTEMCVAIKNWFSERGKLVDDFTCGQQKKSRLAR